MDQGTAALIGAGIGATTALFSSFLAFQYQISIQEKKTELARQEALRKELQNYVSKVEKGMFSVLHTMAWLAWHGWKEQVSGLSLINYELTAQYHKEIHTVVPRLLGDLAFVASLNERIHSTLSEHWHKLQKIEDKIADALVNHKTLPEESLKTLAECHAAIMGLYKSAPMELANSLRLVETSVDTAK